MWPWVDHPLTEMQYVMYFRFCFVDDVIFSHNGANAPESTTTLMFRSVRQMAAPGAKSAVFGCIKDH